MANQKGKHRICPRCRGNGYFKVPNKSVEQIGQSITVQCPMCNSEGEIDDEGDDIIITSDGINTLQ
jgi:DnaJ-class molecular chaperone